MPDPPHPSPADLIGFHRGDLPAAESDAVAAHVEGCPACEAALQALDAGEGTLAAALRRPAGATDVWSTAAGLPLPEGAGTVIGGRYKLVEPVGEGGMGSVWMAQQTEPVRRLVAVKLIKPGMDSRAVLARFDAERQALALMDHPNIARVLDAGATDRGRPFFVMELVKGVPITQYCDDHKLTPRERLALFVPVCQAVQHAHQKGVIHRDLKPSNVLVARYDGRPVPKVIDFGVAKAAGQPLTDKTLVTGLGAVVGTPEYMAPEQAELNQLDVDTRADVYALGVLLYELLTGSTPLTRARLGKAAIVEVLRLVREEEPPTPSSRLSTADALPSLAANRGTEPRRLAALLRGELDWVVMKALEKDRGRRYESAGGFARDIERYLADEPVEAGRPTAAYRLRKFVRRHRRPLLAATAAGLLLAAAAGVSAWQAVRATAAEKRAVEETARAVEEAEAKQAALEQVRQEQGKTAAALAQANDELATREVVQNFFLDKVFAAGRPKGQGGGLGKDVTLRQAIDAAAPDIGPAFRGRPLAEAAVRAALGRTYFYLNEVGLSAAQYEAAHRLLVAAHGADHPEAAGVAVRLALNYVRLNRAPEAFKLLDAAAAAFTARAPDHPDRFLAVESLAAAHLRAGRGPESVRLMEAIIPQAVARFGPDAPETLTALMTLGRTYMRVDRVTEAAGLFERVLAGRRAALPAGHPDILLAGSMTALAYMHTGRAPEAIRLLADEVVPGRTAQIGPDELDTLTAVRYLAEAYLSVGRPAAAVGPLERVVAGRVKRLHPDHPDTLTARQMLVLAHLSAGNTAAALPLLDDYLRRLRGILPAGDPQLGIELLRVGTALLDTRQFARAEPLLREALAIKERAEPGAVPTLDARSLLGAALAGLGRPAEAEPLLLEGYEGLRRRDDLPAHLRPVVAEAADRLVHLYAAWGKPAEAAKWRAERAKHPAEQAPPPRPAR